jgi:DNA-binding NtrC family response regulator
VAEALVRASPRASKPFVRFNCAALTAELAEAELFGHSRGAFTGAQRPRAGLFREADGGTILLDEIGELAPVAQAKLLRVLQEGEVRPVGEDRPQKVDVRVIAATHRDLRDFCARGLFREDLFYRLNVVHLHVPPLRDRREDIPVLARYFLSRYEQRFGLRPLRAPPELIDRLMQHSWPGNVRELENAIERAAVTTVGDTIGPEKLPPRITGMPQEERPRFEIDLKHPLPYYLKIATEQIERQYIMKALEKSRGNVGRCAELCGLSRRSVSGKISQYEIDKYPFKSN